MKKYKVKLAVTKEYITTTSDHTIWSKTKDKYNKKIFTTTDYMLAYGVALEISLSKNIPLSEIIIVIYDSDNDDIIECPVCHDDFKSEDRNQARYDYNANVCPSCNIDGN